MSASCAEHREKHAAIISKLLCHFMDHNKKISVNTKNYYFYNSI